MTKIQWKADIAKCDKKFKNVFFKDYDVIVR